MPYGRLGEGNIPEQQVGRITAPALWADAFQQQVADMLGPRVVAINMCDGLTRLAGTPWIYNVSGFDYWYSTATNEWIYFSLRLRAGEVITEMHAIVDGDAANTGGTIELASKDLDVATAISSVQDIGGTDPFATAAKVVRSQAGGVFPYTTLPSKVYFIRVKSSAAITANPELHALYYTAQFGE